MTKVTILGKQITLTAERKRRIELSIERKRRIELSIIEQQALLDRELGISEDLQNEETVARYRANIAKLGAMIY